MDAEYDDLYQLRDALSRDLTDKADGLFTLQKIIREHQGLELLMPCWKWERFKGALRDSSACVLKAIACLEYKDSPTTEALMNELIWRWASSDSEEKQRIIATLRSAFAPKTKEGQ